MNYPPRIHIREVTARDGLQIESTIVAPTDKIHLIDGLSAAGFPQINVTSFVRPDLVPQTADCVEVMAAIQRRPGVIYDATVPNEKGATRAVAAGADAIVVFVAASEAANQHGVGRSTADALAAAQAAIAVARTAGRAAIATISSAFGSPYGDDVTTQSVVDLADSFVGAGATSIALGDTSGEGTPRQVSELVAAVTDVLPAGIALSLHFHDTRGLGLANVVAALDAGAVDFDSAIGGLGGSPFTANSSGNIATEELVFMCEAMGIETGIDLDAVFALHAFLEATLGHPLSSRLGRLRRSGAAS